MTATEFLQSPDPTQILAERSKIVFEEDEIGQHASTNEEIKACAEDLRVLSKGDFRALLKWREKLLKEGLLKVFDEESSSSEEEDEEEVELDSDAEEDEVQRQIEAQKALVAKDARREKKKRAKEKQKARLRRGAGIVEESNVDEATREQVFSFSEAVKVGGVEALKDQVLDSDEEDGAMNIRPQKGEFGAERAALYEDYLQPKDRMEAIEDQLDTAYEAYADRRAEKSGAPRVEKNKRAKKYRDAVAARIVQDDVELIDGDVVDYAKQLRQGDESSDESSSDESEVDAQAQSSAKRWFTNPLFDAAAVEMPKSERVLRKEKRLKAQQRKDRRDARRGDVEAELDIVETKPEEVFDVKQTAARALIKAGVANWASSGRRKAAPCWTKIAKQLPGRKPNEVRTRGRRLGLWKPGTTSAASVASEAWAAAAAPWVDDAADAGAAAPSQRKAPMVRRPRCGECAACNSKSKTKCQGVGRALTAAAQTRKRKATAAAESSDGESLLGSPVARRREASPAAGPVAATAAAGLDELALLPPSKRRKGASQPSSPQPMQPQSQPPHPPLPPQQPPPQPPPEAHGSGVDSPAAVAQGTMQADERSSHSCSSTSGPIAPAMRRPGSQVASSEPTYLTMGRDASAARAQPMQPPPPPQQPSQPQPRSPSAGRGDAAMAAMAAAAETAMAQAAARPSSPRLARPRPSPRLTGYPARPGSQRRKRGW